MLATSPPSSRAPQAYTSPEAGKLMSLVDKIHEGGAVPGPLVELLEEAIHAASKLEEFSTELADIEEERALTSKQLLSIRSRVGEWRALEGKLVASEAECGRLRERVHSLEEELGVAKGALDESQLLATVADLQGRLTAAAEAGLRIEGERAAEAQRVRETFANQREELEALRADRDAMQARLLELEIEVGEGGSSSSSSSSSSAPKAQQHIVEARASALQAQLQHVGVLYKHRDKLQAEVDGMRKEMEGLQAQLAAANRRNGGGGVGGVPALIPSTPPPSSHRNGRGGGTASPDSFTESPAMLKDGDDDDGDEPVTLGKSLGKKEAKAAAGGCCTVM